METKDRKAARRRVNRIWSTAQRKIDPIIQTAAEKTEILAEELFGKVEPDRFEFGPPADAIKVICQHCGKTYMSDRMCWEYRLEFQSAILDAWASGEDEAKPTPLWWCKEPQCSGAGFGHNIHPLKETMTCP